MYIAGKNEVRVTEHVTTTLIEYLIIKIDTQNGWSSAPYFICVKIEFLSQQIYDLLFNNL